MQRVPRDPTRFESLDWFGDLCASKGRQINDPLSLNLIIDEMKSKLAEMLSDDRRLAGVSHETMFENLVVELGAAQLIKKEDAGSLRSVDPAQIPDFRIVLHDGRCLLVEVKSCNDSVAEGLRLDIPKKELQRLRTYADRTGAELKIAIFWQRVNIWTVVDPSRFRVAGQKARISFVDANLFNEISVFGDLWVATKPPLSVRVFTDPNRPRQIRTDGLGSYVVGSIQMECAGETIEDKAGKDLATYLILFSDWVRSRPVADLDGNTILSIKWDVGPEEPEPAAPADWDQDNDLFRPWRIRIAGSLSSMYSRM